MHEALHWPAPLQACAELPAHVGNSRDRCYAKTDIHRPVLVSKYADHLPLYWQAEIYARQGVE
jgi:transposase